MESIKELAMKIGLVCITLIILLGFPTFNHELHGNDSERAAGFRYGIGSLLLHRDELRYLDNGRFRSLEISYEKRTNGSKDWHRDYNFPSHGYFMSYTDHGNSQNLGYSFTLGAFTRLPLFQIGDLSAIHLRLTGGVCYLEKPFDERSNHRNLAIGTHLNVYFQAMVEYVYSLNHEFDLSLGLKFGHFSNGSFQKPNKGINYSMVFVGINRIFNRGYKVEEEKEEKQVPLGKWQVMLSGSVKSPHIFSDSQYGIGTLQFIHNNQFSPKFFYSVGLDLVYNGSVRRDIQINSGREVGRGYDFHSGVFAGIGMKMGKSSLVLAKGYTLYSRSDSKSGVYHRFSFRRQFGSRFFYHIGIYSRYFKADFLDIGLGYSINSH